ncbi:S1C family serine protease [Polymorphospora lycopeni]|uniref:Trypsin-like peptidase domain-containing protein n=1 Tax=Polymorphospora lycopeni TaxID=3140240 RepID=A0ABV5CMF9_9ACTN
MAGRTTGRDGAAGPAAHPGRGGRAGGGALAARLAEPRTTSVVTAGTVSTGGVVDLAAVASSVAPSVVTVEVATRGGAVTGSGVVLSDDGRILTNDHVVADATGPVTVRLADGRTARATVVGGDPETDLAVLRAEGVDGLTPAVFGDSPAVRVGGTVLALGSPLGLEGTVTAGIVSAVDRTADWLTGLIQTDAPVDAGSSGGAVVGTAGRVVGITVAIATTGADTGNIGVGFAIPSDTSPGRSSPGCSRRPVRARDDPRDQGFRAGRAGDTRDVLPDHADQGELVAGARRRWWTAPAHPRARGASRC